MTDVVDAFIYGLGVTVLLAVVVGLGAYWAGILRIERTTPEDL